MPFSGTGIFSRVYQWTNDAANGLFVDATRTDTDSNDIASGLTNCVTRDGQSPATANIPLGGFKITGLANGALATDAVNFGQVFTNPTFFGLTATGTVNLTGGTVTVATQALGNNTTLAASTAFVIQQAFAAALPAQSLGFLRSSGAAAAFTQTHTGYAQNEVKGADIASAATINLTTATGNFTHVTGTTTITAITIPIGAERTVIFDGALTLTNGAALLLPGAANITTMANDRMDVRGDTAGAIVTNYTRANGTALVGGQYLKVSDQKASGTDGGSSVANTITQTRTFNTVDVNTIIGASLSANQVTLPAGTYRVRGRAPGVQTGGHKAFLYNVTDATYTDIGSNAATAATGGSFSDSVISGQFTIATSKTFSMRHITAFAVATLGLGGAVSSGQVEVYAELEFELRS